MSWPNPRTSDSVGLGQEPGTSLLKVLQLILSGSEAENRYQASKLITVNLWESLMQRTVHTNSTGYNYCSETENAHGHISYSPTRKTYKNISGKGNILKAHAESLCSDGAREY